MVNLRARYRLQWRLWSRLLTPLSASGVLCDRAESVAHSAAARTDALIRPDALAVGCVRLSPEAVQAVGFAPVAAVPVALCERAAFSREPAPADLAKRGIVSQDVFDQAKSTADQAKAPTPRARPDQSARIAGRWHLDFTASRNG
jgi:hypothetical protein